MSLALRQGNLILQKRQSFLQASYFAEATCAECAGSAMCRSPSWSFACAALATARTLSLPSKELRSPSLALREL